MALNLNLKKVENALIASTDPLLLEKHDQVRLLELLDVKDLEALPIHNFNLLMIRKRFVLI